MTNYNERLDKALERLAVAGRGWGVSESVQIESMSSELDETKQALRTLFQEAMDEVIADVDYSKMVNNHVALQRQRAKALLDEMFNAPR